MKKFALIMGFVMIVGTLLPMAGANADETFSNAVLDPQIGEMLKETNAPKTLEVIITYKEDMKIQGMERFDSLGLYHDDLKILPMTATVLPTELIGELMGWNEVRSIYWNAPLQYFLSESADASGTRPVWDTYGELGANTTVMVIDSGVDGTHPDLLYGENLIHSAMSIDIFNDAYTDIEGTVGEDLPDNPIPSFPVSWIDEVPVTDTVGHGTHCLGIVGGRGLAAGGYLQGAADDPLQHQLFRGMAPEADLVSFGMGGVLFVWGCILGFEYALEHCDDYGIDVISNSWGPVTVQEFDANDPTNVATLACYKAGMLVVFAGGNDGPDKHTMGQYSVAPWTMSVAAGTKDLKLADFSSRGTEDENKPYDHPDITAPGVSIISAKAKTGWLQALGPTDNTNPSQEEVVAEATFYTHMSGTSMACPHIAGIAGLLFSANPQLSPDQVMDILVETADAMGEQPVYKVGAGYVNTTAAYLLALETEGNLEAFKAGEMKYDGGEDDPLFGLDCIGVGYDYWPVEEPAAESEEVESNATPGFGAILMLASLAIAGAVFVIARKRSS